MPTRYRSPLTKKSVGRKEKRWKGMAGHLMSVCTNRDRLTLDVSSARLLRSGSQLLYTPKTAEGAPIR